MRAFIAVELPKELKESIGRFQDEINMDFGNSLKLVENENLHITLRFFPEIDEKIAEEIKKIINSLEFEPFIAICKGIGVFPNQNFIRVIWIGVESTKKLEKLESVLSDKIQKIYKFKKESHFISHITVARVKRKIDFNRYLSKYSNYEFGKFLIDKRNIKLKMSKLTPDGPIYTDL
ncbi:MAG: RNA 2',3'-cyclic phosphodiesterase [Candidatus Micrarchaeota archaeon]|nr:RNA 2',3'-cyclic phosphodiesterase [Candidatus Micrarchaeota archaeon]